MVFARKWHALYALVTVASLGCGVGAPSSTEAGAASTPPKGHVVSAQELSGVINLQKLALPAGAEQVHALPARVSCTAPLGVQAAAEFLLKTLAQQGFKPDTTTTTVTPEYASAQLQKDGFQLTLTVMPQGQGKSQVVIDRLGALDARQLPQSAGAKPLFGSPTQQLYVASGSVAEEVGFLRSALQSAGWQEFTAPNTATVETPEQVQLSFRNRGYRLNAFVSVAPAQNNQTSVHYTLGTLSYELPAPITARKVEYDDARWILTCEIPGDMDHAAGYYASAMSEAGYEALEHDEPKPTGRVLRFKTPDKAMLMLTLTPAEENHTAVRATYVPAEVLEAAKQRDLKAEKE